MAIAIEALHEGPKLVALEDPIVTAVPLYFEEGVAEIGSAATLNLQELLRGKELIAPQPPLLHFPGSVEGGITGESLRDHLSSKPPRVQASIRYVKLSPDYRRIVNRERVAMTAEEADQYAAGFSTDYSVSH